MPWMPFSFEAIFSPHAPALTPLRIRKDPTVLDSEMSNVLVAPNSRTIYHIVDDISKLIRQAKLVKGFS